MKRMSIVTALAAILFMLAACGEKQAKQSGADKKTSAALREKGKVQEGDHAGVVAASGDNDSAADADGLYTDHIGTIRKVWASKQLTPVAGGETASIKLFASAFCKAYPDYSPNHALNDYFRTSAKDKDKVSYDDLTFYIEHQKKNGYIMCRGETEISFDTDACYWKRNNGHCLVAFWMVRGHEDETEKSDVLLVFYDYDPSTDTMRPEPSLTKQVEDAMSAYDEYTVKLPSQGKDIEIIGHKANPELDNYDNTDYLFRWNGYDFKLERV